MTIEATAGSIGEVSIEVGSVGTGAATTELIHLLDRYEQSLFAFVLALLGDRDSAKDCVQDTFLRAYENLRKGRSVNVKWLYKVARNRAVDELRHTQREQHNPEPLDPSTPDELPTSTHRTVAVHRALLRLSTADREVLYLAEVDGFTSNQIGDMLGIRAGAVRMRLCRAQERFRHVYGNPP